MHPSASTDPRPNSVTPSSDSDRLPGRARGPRRRGAAAAILLAGVLVAGCSSGTPSESPGTTGSTGGATTVERAAEGDGPGTTGTTPGTTPGTSRGTTPGTTRGTEPVRDSTTTTEPDGTTTTKVVTPTSANPEHEVWCTEFRSGIVELNERFADAESESDLIDRLKAFHTQMRASAPEEIADAWARLDDLVQPLGSLDDLSDQVAYDDAQREIEVWSIANCGFDPNDP